MPSTPSPASFGSPSIPTTSGPVAESAMPAKPGPATVASAGTGTQAGPSYPPGTSTVKNRLYDVYNKERNPFDVEFGAIKQKLPGSFPAKWHPVISSDLLKKIRACPSETNNLQEAVDRLLNPDTNRLSYRDAKDDPKLPLKPDLTFLCCFLQKTPRIHVVLVCKTHTQEVIQVQLRDATNTALWNSAVPTAVRTGVKRKHSELDEGSDIVPQYDKIVPKEEITTILKKNPNITPIGLLKQLKVSLTLSQSREGAVLSKHFAGRFENLIENLANFYTGIAAYLDSEIDGQKSLSTSQKSAATSFASLLVNAVYGEVPVQRLFNNAKLKTGPQVIFSLQLRLIERYKSSDEMTKETAVDAFVNVALQIKKNRRDGLTKLTAHRSDIYKLDGDKELVGAYKETLILSDDRESQRWKIVVTLPEIAHKLKISKEELFSVIREWGPAPGSVSDKKIDRLRTQIKEELPAALPYDMDIFMGQLAIELAKQLALESKESVVASSSMHPI